MTNKYLDHMQSKPTHERRQHAMRVAGVLTALVFVGWVTTLGVRLGGTSAGSVQVAGTDNVGQTAAALNSGYDAAQGGNQLIVSTTTDY